MELKKHEAIKFFSDFYFGEHHIPSEIKEHGSGWAINHRGDLATYDFNHLTRLVVMAHDRAIRVSILPSGPGIIKIAIHKREHNSGSVYRNHPSLEDAVEWIRMENPPKHPSTRAKTKRNEREEI